MPPTSEESKAYYEKVKMESVEKLRQDLTELGQCGFYDFDLQKDLLSQYKVEEVGGMLMRFSNLQ